MISDLLNLLQPYGTLNGLVHLIINSAINLSIPIFWGFCTFQANHQLDWPHKRWLHSFWVWLLLVMLCWILALICEQIRFNPHLVSVIPFLCLRLQALEALCFRVVHPSVCLSEIPCFHLYMGPLVHLTNRSRFTACLSVRPSVHPSVRPSVRRGFRAFTGEHMEGMAWNFHADVSWPPSELIRLWSRSVDFPPFGATWN